MLRTKRAFTLFFIARSADARCIAHVTRSVATLMPSRRLTFFAFHFRDASLFHQTPAGFRHYIVFAGCFLILLPPPLIRHFRHFDIARPLSLRCPPRDTRVAI